MPGCSLICGTTRWMSLESLEMNIRKWIENVVMPLMFILRADRGQRPVPERSRGSILP